ncbi:hypothetical protein H9Y04_20015 [Streptomyces sp. TRM66268-LWL]|uniref:Integral membrane protein n=1 Tax=Streptomyces polyasparticus TaxID=2767826 RepID=A0ABR7SH54_9ACTN|nr:hypothetical protein [Streptomyces polyasparticus]MBC9714841.1 hypothetical protein [Streptomyces polyasparticus]
MESDSGKSVDARGALDDIRRARGWVSERVGSPWWFHGGLGLLVAQQVVVNGVAEGLWTLVSFGVLVLGATVLVLCARRATGVTPTWPRGPRANALMAVRMMVALGAIWGAALLGREAVGAVAALAVGSLLATVLLGFAYDSALRQDIAEGSDAG